MDGGTRSFTATLAITPVPKGRPRFGRGRVYTPHETTQFETSVRWLLRQQKAPMLTGRLAVDATFWIGSQLADGDNYMKALLDAMQGICYANDRQVREHHCYLLDATADAKPHISVMIWQLDLTGRIIMAGGAAAAAEAAAHALMPYPDQDSEHDRCPEPGPELIGRQPPHLTPPS